MSYRRLLNTIAGTTGLDATAAANVAAGTTGQSMRGALNVLNGTVGMDIGGVCNALAGTTGQDPIGALEVYAATPPAFAPTDIASLRFWFDGEQVAQADDTNLTSLPDSSGLGNNGALTGTAAKLRTNVTPNGTNIARWSGTTGDYGFSGLLTGATAAEMMVVLKKDAGQNGSWVFGTASDQSYYTYSGTVYEAFGCNGSEQMSFSPSMTISDGTFHVYDVWAATNDYAVVMDGVSQVTNTSYGAVSFPATPIIGRAQSSVFRGDIAEVCVFNAKLSTEDRASMLAYLQDKHL